MTNIKISACALMLSLSSCLTGNTFASGQPVYDYYDVEGNTLNQLRQSLNKHGPKENGKQFHAHAQWYVSWNFRYQAAMGQCKVTTVNTNTTSTIIFPRWRNADSASNKLQQDWQRYTTALRAHEEGHYLYGVKAAEQIKNELSRTTDPSDCRNFDKQLNDKANAILQKILLEEKDYDRQTNHGETQGARF